MCLTVFFRERLYKVDVAELEPHFWALLTLIDCVPIFPNPVQMLAQGKKLAATFFLRVAALSLGHSLPLVSVVEPPTWDTVQEIIAGERETVMKREFSDSSCHVIRRGHKISKVDWEKMLDDAKVWESLRAFGPPCWLEQPFVPELMYVGEIRTLVVNGVLAYILASKASRNENWEVKVMQKILPLKLMK
jgi:hypothetical protein